MKNIIQKKLLRKEWHTKHLGKIIQRLGYQSIFDSKNVVMCGAWSFFYRRQECDHFGD